MWRPTVGQRGISVLNHCLECVCEFVYHSLIPSQTVVKHTLNKFADIYILQVIGRPTIDNHRLGNVNVYRRWWSTDLQSVIRGRQSVVRQEEGQGNGLVDTWDGLRQCLYGTVDYVACRPVQLLRHDACRRCSAVQQLRRWLSVPNPTRNAAAKTCSYRQPRRWWTWTRDRTARKRNFRS